jgi:hypothetical protein
LAQEKGWSYLCVVSEYQDWFRDLNVIRHFDRLIDDGLLDQFDDVIFLRLLNERLFRRSLQR